MNWRRKKVFIFPLEEKVLLKRRTLRLLEQAYKTNIPYLVAMESWTIFLQANQYSYLKASAFILKAWWRHVTLSARVLRFREWLYHLRTGRDGTELWDKKQGDPPGTMRIEREEIKTIIEGREPTDKIQ
jgi:hypothetical protein